MSRTEAPCLAASRSSAARISALASSLSRANCSSCSRGSRRLVAASAHPAGRGSCAPMMLPSSGGSTSDGFLLGAVRAVRRPPLRAAALEALLQGGHQVDHLAVVIGGVWGGFPPLPCALPPSGRPG